MTSVRHVLTVRRRIREDAHGPGQRGTEKSPASSAAVLNSNSSRFERIQANSSKFNLWKKPPDHVPACCLVCHTAFFANSARFGGKSIRCPSKDIWNGASRRSALPLDFGREDSAGERPTHAGIAGNKASASRRAPNVKPNPWRIFRCRFGRRSFLTKSAG